MEMRRMIVGLVICLLFISMLSLGCFEESNGKKKNKAPTADAGEDIEVLTLTEIQFDASNSEDPDGKIVEYEWDFGDYKNPLGGQPMADNERPTTFITGCGRVETHQGTPSGWDLAELAIRGLCDVLLAHRLGATLFAMPKFADRFQIYPRDPRR